MSMAKIKKDHKCEIQDGRLDTGYVGRAYCERVQRGHIPMQYQVAKSERYSDRCNGLRQWITLTQMVIWLENPA